MTKKILTYIEAHSACHTALRMSKGDLPNGGKHDKKTQAHWHRLIAIKALKGNPSERWHSVPDDSKELALIICNHINKYTAYPVTEHWPLSMVAGLRKSSLSVRLCLERWVMES